MQPVLDQSDDGNADENEGRHREGHDDLRGECVGVGHHAEQVAEEQENEEREDEGEIGAPFASDIAFHKVCDEFIHHLGSALQSAGNHLALAHCAGKERTTDDHGKQHEQAGVGEGDVVTARAQLEDRLDLELLDR